MTPCCLLPSLPVETVESVVVEAVVVVVESVLSSEQSKEQIGFDVHAASLRPE